MYQYTTETIINSNVGNLEGVGGAKVRACVYANDGTAKASMSADSDVLVIDGVNSFIKKYVTRVTKYPYRAADNAEATLTVALPATLPGIARLTVMLREEGRSSSIMQDAYLHHTKPFHFEVEVGASDTAAAVATKLVKIIKKSLAMSDFKFFSVSANGAVLTFTGADCHIRFAEAPVLDEIRPATVRNIAAVITGFEDYINIATGTVTKVGDCGAGTVEHLIKDLRIPTGASINPFGADQGGKPVPGGQYTQYLVEYETPRAHVAHGVMGSVGEKSRTSHVFFVESAAVSTVGALLEGLVASPEAVAIPASGIAAPKQKPGSVQ